VCDLSRRGSSLEASAIVGTPESGAAGIVESVDDIMARDQLSPDTVKTESLPRLESNRAKTSASAAGAQTAQAAIGPPAAPETVGTNFKAIGYSESGFIPPDTAGDVGPTQILVEVNGRIRAFAKTGAPAALSSTALSFWASVANGSQPIFPQIRYDRLSGRWILMAVNSAKPNNRIMIAVQTTPGTITGASSFTFYQFNQTSGGGNGDQSNTCDSPRLGIDNNALYIGCNMYKTSGSLDRVTVYVVRKSSIIPAPGTLVVTALRDISNGANGPGPFTPVGVDNDDAQATTGYFIGVDMGTLGLLQLRSVSDPGGTPTLSGNRPLTVPATAYPTSQPASGSTVSIDAGDDRLIRASIHTNKLTGAATLWTSHGNEVDASCVSGVGGGRNGARWYQIAGGTPTAADPLGGTPALVQSGTLCDPASTNPKGFIYPSVVETGQGHMAMGSSFAASNLFAGAASAGRLRFDPAGVTQAATTLQSGLAAYTFVTLGRNRWGDYSFTGVDPNDDQTAWTFQEYADQTPNNWAVRAVQLRASPPPALTGLQATVCVGAASVPVTLTGTADAPLPGAEFFDPGPDPGGPGYANHLTATATGGVVINGAPGIVIPANPSTQPVLQVTLSLDTTGATAGLKNITIKNPDGQTTTGVGVVRVDHPATPVATNSGPVCIGGTLQLSVATVKDASYSWTGPDGFNSALQNPTISNVTPAAAGTYVVTFSGTGCAVPQAETTVQVLGEGASCEDGNACTTGDTCAAGTCQAGTAVVCNDNNVCTTDSCAPATGCVFTDMTAVLCADGNVCTDDLCDPASGCFHANNTFACDDGNPCTTTDTCGGGSCQPGPAADCNDNNACTADSCSPASGCVHTDSSASCNDGNACTADTCDPASGCVFTDTTAAACNDNNICTDDLCNPASGCFHQDNTSPCDDANACTTGDTCGGGSCQPGTAVVCDDANVCTADTCVPATGCVFTDTTAVLCSDGNVCTDDQCDPATGCFHTDNTASCEDGNACTSGDTCGAGSCQPGPATVCDDANVCTDDSCDPASGCVFTNNTLACNDGNACTLGDTCGGGDCNPGAPIVCDDGLVCTDDFCSPATGCVFRINTAACDDGNACTVGDTCSVGLCVPGTATLNCDDGNPCTDDSCDTRTGCDNEPNTADCDDGSACTTGDVCADGICQPGATVICDDGNACTADSCDPALGCVNADSSAACDDGNPCTDDSCDPATGCVHVNNTGSCSDGNACTAGDTCAAGVCHSGSVVFCDDANVCTADECHPETGCVFIDLTAGCDDGNACTADSCDPVSGCQHADASATCDDGNVCTDDSCDPATGCLHQDNNASCNDGSACTAGDTCAGGACQPGVPVVCDDGNACTVDSCQPAIGCQFADNSAACDDGNPCTDDSCDPATGCVHTNNSASCNDGNACTAGDSCNGGSCQPGIPVVCNDDDVCTADSCNPATGCVYTNVTASLCNDGNVCTDDLCDPANGCFHVDNTAACDDGNVCTNGDTCSAGVCTGGITGLPPEVHGVTLLGRTATTLSWTGLSGGPDYDVASSTLASLRTGGTAGATCLVNDEVGTSTVDPQSDPATGQGYYYLIRAQAACGTGSYGFNSAGGERVPAAGCP
jgi:hypothetical protein